MTPRPRLAVAAVLAGLTVAGCSASGGSPTTTAAPPPTPRPHLPSGWRRAVNHRGGFSLGVPRHWSARRHGTATILRSADHSLAISANADRSPSGRVAPPALYAERALHSLTGYRHLRTRRARPLSGAPLPAAGASATGTFVRTRVRQRIDAIILHQDRSATFSLLVFTSARTPASRHARTLRRLVRTVHPETPRA